MDPYLSWLFSSWRPRLLGASPSNQKKKKKKKKKKRTKTKRTKTKRTRTKKKRLVRWCP